MSRFLKWKWLLRSALVLVVLGLAVPLAVRFYVRWQCQSRLAARIQQLDESDPGWTKDELCAARNARLLPPDRNSFTVVRSIRSALPDKFDSRTEYLNDAQGRPANVELRAGELEALRRHLAACEPALAVARSLVHYPEGGRAVTIPEMPLDMDLEPVQQTRTVVWLLQLDALVAAHERRGVDGIRNARAALNAARAIGDEPSMISQLVRIACAAVACNIAERVLGLTDPDRDLDHLQAELLREADVPRLRDSFRAERASAHQLFRLLESGDINKLGPAGVPGGGGGLLDRLEMWGLRTYLPEDHRFTLEMMTATVEAGRRPFDEQWAALKAAPNPVDGDRRHFLSNLLSASVGKIGEAALRSRGDLLATAAAIACERYRRRTGRWPESLNDIPNEILPAVPNDPFTGKPICLRRLPDGIVVYSVGPDETDDGGAVREDPATGRRQSDYGIRLWDPAARRQAPPEPKDDGPPGPGETQGRK